MEVERIKVQVRLPMDVHRFIRVSAAEAGKSFNAYLAQLIEDAAVKRRAKMDGKGKRK